MGYMLVYKIFEKMYLVLGWTSNHMGKLAFSTAFLELLGQKQQIHILCSYCLMGEINIWRASCIKKGSQS